MDACKTPVFSRRLRDMPASNAPQSRKVRLSPEEESARQVLALTMRLLGKTDTDVAAPMGKKYQAVQQRRRGETRIRLGDVAELATALDVPADLFSMDPLDAGSWLLSNRRDQVIAAAGCFGRTAEQDACLTTAPSVDLASVS